MKTRSRLPSVLVVDDEPDLAELLELTLIKMGLEVTVAHSVAEARKALDNQPFALCLSDMRLGDGDGRQVIQYIQQQGLDVPIAIITAFGSLDNAVEVLKAGAFDYLSKPVSLEQLRTLVRSALGLDAPQKPLTPTEQTFWGESPAIALVRERVERFARSNAPVYITGESGSGKERAARLIHEKGPRADKPFVPVNCGAIPENLMESEFFGYRKGAFTGADADRDGFFQAANGGTLFLDEVADLPLAMQVKLLRVIQEKKVRKVGATQEETVDVRIISATHQDLASCVEQGRFRQDLYYRLNVIQLQMPALREMREDILLIANRLLARLCEQVSQRLPQFEEEASRLLQQYSFPGNVRELENVLERALALCDGQTISAEDLQLTCHDAELDVSAAQTGVGLPLQDYLDQVERQAILAALEQTRFNRTAAARLLGVTFRSLRYRMERLGIQ